MLFGTAIPIVPGKTDRVRRFAEELEAHRQEYEVLNARFGLSGHAMWINEERDGTDVVVQVYDIPSAELLAEMRSREWDMDSSYDRWWTDWVKDVLGIDLLAEMSLRAPPENVFSWEG